MVLLARVLGAKGDHEEAREIARRLLAQSENTRDWGYALRQAATISERGESWDEAADLFGKLLAHQLAELGDNVELTAFAREGLARVEKARKPS